MTINARLTSLTASCLRITKFWQRVNQDGSLTEVNRGQRYTPDRADENKVLSL